MIDVPSTDHEYRPAPIFDQISPEKLIHLKIVPNFELTKVDPNRLLNAAGNIESSLGSLTNSFRRIDAALQNTLAPTWESPAKQMFFGQYANDIQLFNNQLDVLGKFNEQLKAAAGIFANADSSVNDVVNKLQVGN
jgi:WXG100 family type VII secretion target